MAKEPAKNETEFQKLLRVAIGNTRTHGEFSEQSGISRSHLSRLVNNSSSSAPSPATLRAIADNSEGRVTLAQLEAAVSNNVLDVTIQKKSCMERQHDMAESMKKGISEFAGRATTYGSIQEMLDLVVMLYAEKDIDVTRFDIEEPVPYSDKGHYGAENLVHITVHWKDDQSTSKMGFSLFFCETKGDRVIISDAVFDLPTLSRFEHPIAGHFLLRLSEQENAYMSDYQTCCLVSITDEEEKERYRMRKEMDGILGITRGMSKAEREEKYKKFLAKLFEDGDD